MNLIQSYTTKNLCYKNATQIRVKGLVIHSVGCSQPSAPVFVQQFDNSGVKKAVHAFLEPTGNVYQTLPWNFKAWHVGGNANATHIGVEMTEPSTIKYTGGASWVDLNPGATASHVAGTYTCAVELFAYLCKLYNLDPLVDGVVLSHTECHRRGLGSGHADVEHIWSKFGITMDKFRQDISVKLGSTVVDTIKIDATTQATVSTVDLTTSNELYRVRKNWTSEKSQIGAYKSLQAAKDMADKQGGYNVYDSTGKLVYSGKIKTESNSFTPYKVTPTSTLNVRSTPVKDASNSNVVGQVVPPGIYTVVEENNGFGRLKSGAGWISLDYVNRIV